MFEKKMQRACMRCCEAGKKPVNKPFILSEKIKLKKVKKNIDMG